MIGANKVFRDCKAPPIPINPEYRRVTQKQTGLHLSKYLFPTLGRDIEKNWSTETALGHVTIGD